MRVLGRSRARAAVVTCEGAKESISARLDGERHPLAEPALAHHLAGCRACRDFEADAVAIGRRALLRAPRPVPGDLVASLVPLLEASPTGLLATKRHRHRARAPSFGWTSSARWAAALVPAATAIVAVSVGVGSNPHLVPTRPPSPCTVGLMARHLPRGG